MDLTRALDFVRTNHRAVLATRRRDGGLQLSPVVAVANDEGVVLVSSRERAYKVRNLRRDPRASLLVMSDGFYGPWVQLDGHASVVSLPEAMEGLVDYYRRAAGEHPDWDEYRAAMIQEQRVLVRLVPDHAGPDRSG
jgi:PPOX class probable F420-dependent enzyme